MVTSAVLLHDARELWVFSNELQMGFLLLLVTPFALSFLFSKSIPSVAWWYYLLSTRNRGSTRWIFHVCFPTFEGVIYLTADSLRPWYKTRPRLVVGVRSHCASRARLPSLALLMSPDGNPDETQNLFSFFLFGFYYGNSTS